MFCSRRGTGMACLAVALLAACSLDVTQAPPPTRLGIPEGWGGSYENQAGIGITSIDHHSGAAAVYLSGQGDVARQAVLSQGILPDHYLGSRVRLSAWVKAKDVSGEYAGMWMRVDGPFSMLAFDNMKSRPVIGSSDWQQVSIVLNVPATAVGIYFGALFRGSGTLIVDDIAIEKVDTSVPVTDVLTGPPDSTSSSNAAAYANAVSVPVNMGFEGIPTATDETVSWLSGAATSLTTTDPTLPLTDLEAFGQMIGSARVVGLGEGTHGTREFQRMKHRMLRYLVEQKGFTQFAIEASSPEAEDINRYVLTGQGDPTRLLSTLRFWISNTQEVLDMVQWMRAWNSTAPVERRVQFHGIDIQQPGGAMDTVEAFIGRVDPARSSYVRTRFACFDFYKSYGAAWGSPMSVYAIRLATSRAACALGAKEVHDLLKENAAAYTAASSADTYATALHSARLLQQWEAMATVTSSANALPAVWSRDSSMAENVRWHADRAAPGAKIVVWAHNEHIVRAPYMMGKHLHAAYGNDYVPVGLLFGSGTLNAVYSGTVQLVRPDVVPTAWIESTFLKTGKAHLLLDARLIAAGGPAAAPLMGPIRMRSIGSTYSLSAPAGFYRSHSFPGDFDLLMFVASGQATTVFPYVF